MPLITSSNPIFYLALQHNVYFRHATVPIKQKITNTILFVVSFNLQAPYAHTQFGTIFTHFPMLFSYHNKDCESLRQKDNVWAFDENVIKKVGWGGWGGVGGVGVGVGQVWAGFGGVGLGWVG